MERLHWTEVKDDLIDMLNNEGYETEFREQYSGRGMYGATVPALVTGADPMFIGAMIALLLSEASEDRMIDAYDLREALPKNSDNMGRSDRVYY